MIQAIIFDIGNVLLSFDYSRAVQAFRQHADLDADQAMSEILALRDDFECGRMPLTEFTAQLRRITGHPGSDDEIQQAYADIFDPVPATWKLAEDLAPRYPLYLLSNTSELHISFVREKFPVFELFPHGIYSHEVGCMKPDPKIYQAAIERTGSRPDELIFIDDMEHNVSAARDAGIHTHHYHLDHHHDLLEFLSNHGVV